MDNILIYIKDLGKCHIETVWWVLEVLKKYGFHANLKKCHFHQDEVKFLGFVVSIDGIRIEEESIDAIKKWPEPKSVQDIQVFIGFANFYCHFIKGFRKITAPFTAILKTTRSSVTSASRVGGDEVVGSRGIVSRGAVGGSDASRKLAKSKSQTKSRHLENNDNLEELKVLTSNPKEAFNHLKQAFTKALILWHFDLECYIRIETNVSGYVIGEVLSQLTSNQVTSNGTIGSNIDWHPMAYFSRQIIPAETQYETHNNKLLAIIKIFKTWQDYLEDCKYEVLVLIVYNNLCRFMDTKSLSSRQVNWAQELFHYHFRINYCQGKANKAANALSWYFQRSVEEENNLYAENIKILHRVMSWSRDL